MHDHTNKNQPFIAPLDLAAITNSTVTARGEVLTIELEPARSSLH